jgi:hypothetical protein
MEWEFSLELRLGTLEIGHPYFSSLAVQDVVQI